MTAAAVQLYYLNSEQIHSHPVRQCAVTLSHGEDHGNSERGPLQSGLSQNIRRCLVSSTISRESETRRRPRIEKQ